MEDKQRKEATDFMFDMSKKLDDNGYADMTVNALAEMRWSLNADYVDFSRVYSQSFGWSVLTKITVFGNHFNPNLSDSYTHVTFGATPANILQLIEDCRAFVKSSPVNPK